MREPETHIAIIGHSKHGKSTVAGRLIYALNGISDTDLEKSREEALERGKDFNKFSLIFLKQATDMFQEGKKDLRMDSSRTVFPMRGNVRLMDENILTIIGTPGHSSFLENIIYGIYMSDLAILVIDASASARYGTERLTRIIASFEIPIIAILVTKMDIVGYSELRYMEIVDEIEKYILPILIESQDHIPPIIPVSALTGVGFTDISPDISWYQGITVIDTIRQSQQENAPEVIGQTRFIIEGGQGVYSPRGVGTVLVGVLETGKLQVNDMLVIQPKSISEGRQITLRVKSLQKARPVNEKKGVDAASISARAVVAIATSDLDPSVARCYFRHGGVLGTLSNPPTVGSIIESEIYFFEPDSVYSGKEYILHTNASYGSVRIIKLEKNPMVLSEVSMYVPEREILPCDLELDEYDAKSKEIAKATIRTDKPICIESSAKYQRLSRFVLREKNRIVACGRCLSVQ